MPTAYDNLNDPWLNPYTVTDSSYDVMHHVIDRRLRLLTTLILNRNKVKCNINQTNKQQ